MSSFQSLPFVPSLYDITRLTELGITQHGDLVRDLTESITLQDATFENVVLPLVHLQNEQDELRSVISILKSVSPQDDIQEAATQSGKAWKLHESTLQPGLFALLNAVKIKADTEQSLDNESRKLLDRMLLRYTKVGYGTIDEHTIEQGLKTEAKIKELCNQIQHNMRQPYRSICFTGQELDGVPERERGTKQPDGRYLIDSSGQYYNIMKRAHNPDTRRYMLVHQGSLRSESAPLFKEVLLLRNQLAQLRGLPHHAATKIPYHLIRSTEGVGQLLESLADALIPSGRDVHEKTRQKKLEHMDKMNLRNGQRGETELWAWDELYYRRMLDDDRAGQQLDEGLVSEYFPMEHTVKAMLDFFADCLQFRLVAIPKEEMENFAWDEHMHGWSLWDQRQGVPTGDEFIGYLFTDLYRRPNKIKTPFSGPLSSGFVRADGSRAYPANLLVCNSEPHPDTGALLKHAEVIVLFHEFGHSLHQLMSRARYATFHATSTTRELSEGIAMACESLVWSKDVIKAINLHYTRVDESYRMAWQEKNPGRDLPPEKMPDALIELRLQKRASAKLSSVLGNLVYSIFDLAVHTIPDEKALQDTDEGEIHNDIFERLRFRRMPEPNYRYLSGVHLVAGYDAAYYSYVCAEVLAADIFQSSFSENPGSREAWQHFREGILKYGGSRDDLEMVESFLGRRMTLEPLLSIMGLEVSGNGWVL